MTTDAPANAEGDNAHNPQLPPGFSKKHALTIRRSDRVHRCRRVSASSCRCCRSYSWNCLATAFLQRPSGAATWSSPTPHCSFSARRCWATSAIGSGRRPLLLVSLFLYGVNYLITAFATSLWLLFLGRALTGAAASTYSVANALIADVSPPDERAQNFGLLGMAFGLGFIFGPTIGGLLGEIDIRAPFFAAAVLAFCNTAYGYFVLKETLPADKRRRFDWKRANPVGALLQIRKYPMLIGLLLTVFIYNVGHHVYPTNWNFYTIAKFDWTPFDIGLSMGLVGILMAFVQGYLIRKVIPVFGAPRTALIGFFAASVSYVGIAFAPNAMAVYLWCGVSALSGLIMPAVQSLMANQVPQQEQGELQGILASMGSVGAIIGPWVMTQSFAYFTHSSAPIYFPGAAFLIAGLLSVLAVAIFALNVRSLIDTENKQPANQEAT